MPSLFIYLLKVNASLILFYLAYRFLLRPLTFYYLNRFFMLFALFFSTVYPFIDLSSFFRSNPGFTGKLVVIVPDWQHSVAVLVVAPQSDHSTVWPVLGLLFWSGVAFFGIRLIIRLFSLYRLHKRSAPAIWRNYHFRVTMDNVNPFSFLNSIYLNESALETEDLEAVLSHEQVHITELHTADVLLSELNSIFYWFNPGAWLMKNAVKENLEFITDRKVLKSGTDSKSYQYSLIRVVGMNQSYPIVNHFNLITLKNRIVMMNKKRSSSIQATKYFILLPAVIVLTMVFTISKAQLERTGRSVLSVIRTTGALHSFAAAKPELAEEQKENRSMIKQLHTPVAGAISILHPSDIRMDEQALQLPELSLSADTSYYNVDGKTVDGIQEISPENISSVRLLNKDQAAKVFGTGYPKGVVLLFTKANRSSEAVTEVQRKMREAGIPAMNSGLASVTVTPRGGGGQGGYISRDTAASKSSLSAAELLTFMASASDGKTITAVKINGKTIDNFTFTPVPNKTSYIRIMLNGKEISEEEMKKVPLTKIKELSVVKGVVVINTKN